MLEIGERTNIDAAVASMVKAYEEDYKSNYGDLKRVFSDKTWNGPGRSGTIGALADYCEKYERLISEIESIVPAQFQEYVRALGDKQETKAVNACSMLEGAAERAKNASLPLSEVEIASSATSAAIMQMTTQVIDDTYHMYGKDIIMHLDELEANIEAIQKTGDDHLVKEFTKLHQKYREDIVTVFGDIQGKAPFRRHQERVLANGEKTTLDKLQKLIKDCKNRTSFIQEESKECEKKIKSVFHNCSEKGREGILDLTRTLTREDVDSYNKNQSLMSILEAQGNRLTIRDVEYIDKVIVDMRREADEKGDSTVKLPNGQTFKVEKIEGMDDYTYKLDGRTINLKELSRNITNIYHLGRMTTAPMRNYYNNAARTAEEIAR